MKGEGRNTIIRPWSEILPTEEDIAIDDVVALWEDSDCKKEDDEKVILNLTKDCPQYLPEVRRRCQSLRRMGWVKKLV